MAVRWASGREQKPALTALPSLASAGVNLGQVRAEAEPLSRMHLHHGSEAKRLNARRDRWDILGIFKHRGANGAP